MIIKTLVELFVRENQREQEIIYRIKKFSNWKELSDKAKMY